MRNIAWLLGFLWLTSACVRNEIVVPAQSVPVHSEENTWARQTNVKEDVDISDLEENITTESPTNIVTQAPQPIKRIPFPQHEYDKLATSGNGTVKGKIYLIDLYGQPVVGSGTRLYLNPVTSYSKQWYNESYLGGKKMQKADPRLFNYLRFTSSDAEGNFAFYGVPSGKYFLIGTVSCAQECGFDNEKRVRIATVVEVQGAQTIQKDLRKHITLE